MESESKIGPPPDKRLLSEQLTNVVQMLGAQIQATWNMFAVFVVTNSIFGVAAVEGTTSGEVLFASIIIAFFGLIVSALWFALLWDALNRMRLGDDLAQRLQELLLDLSSELRLPSVTPFAEVVWLQTNLPKLLKRHFNKGGAGGALAKTPGFAILAFPVFAAVGWVVAPLAIRYLR